MMLKVYNGLKNILPLLDKTTFEKSWEVFLSQGIGKIILSSSLYANFSTVNGRIDVLIYKNEKFYSMCSFLKDYYFTTCLKNVTEYFHIYNYNHTSLYKIAKLNEVLYTRYYIKESQNQKTFNLLFYKKINNKFCYAYQKQGKKLLNIEFFFLEESWGDIFVLFERILKYNTSKIFEFNTDKNISNTILNIIKENKENLSNSNFYFPTKSLEKINDFLLLTKDMKLQEVAIESLSFKNKDLLF